MLKDLTARAPVEALRPRFERLRLQHSRLVGIREAAERREAQLTQKVSQAKGRLSLVEDADAALEIAQQESHERSVGIFERLLTAILKDVLPDKGAVKLELGTERGQPSLRVRIENNGHLEDALEGSGGAVTNVLVAGLRFSALSRTQNRRFVVMDEADCWLKPDLVPAFIKVLAEVSRQVQIQTVLISHHQPAFFDGMTNLVRLMAGPQGPVAQALEPRLTNWDSDETPGVRSIRLINFKAHNDTLIPLFPGVTALIGDNDLGKSTAAVAAIRAVAYGDSDDTVIRHGASEARIILTLENGRRVEWKRLAKGSPKVTYALYEGGSEEPKFQGAGSRGAAPEWISQALGISRVDELDIQLISQKNPVFLLNEPPSTQAKLLSVGRESGRLHELIEAYGELKRKDREQVREGEAEIMRLHYHISSSTVLTRMPQTFERLGTCIAEVESHSNKVLQLKKLLERMESASRRLAHASREQAVLAKLPAQLPPLHDLRSLARLVSVLTRAQPISNLARPYPAVQPPVLTDLARLRELGLTIARLTPKAGIKLPPPSPARLPELADTKVLVRLIDTIARASRLGGCTVPPAPDRVPPLTDTQVLARLIGSIAKASRLTGCTVPALPEQLPRLSDCSAIIKIASRILAQQNVLEQAKRDFEAASADEKEALNALQQTAESLGGLCPLCSGMLPEELGGAAHHHEEGVAA